MNEMNVKLEKIKKSCRFGKNISLILCILCIAGCVIAMVGGIAMITGAEKFEPEFVKLADEGKINTSNGIGTAKMVNLGSIDPSDWESDVPAIQEALSKYPYSTVYGGYCVVMSLCIAVAAVMMKLLSSVFDLIGKEETPFTDKVIRRVTVVMIVLSGFLLMTAGAALGVLSGIATWVIYTVMDYGKTLQIQSDETL